MKKVLKKIGASVITLMLSFMLSFPSVVLAENGDGNGGNGGGNGGSSETIKATEARLKVGEYLKAEGQGDVKAGFGAYVVRVVNFLSLVIGSFALLAIVIGGFMLITAGGAEAQLQKGKDIIKYAIIGLLVAMSAYFLTAFVQSIFFEYGTAGG